jgi:hypothetical protein
MFHSLCNEINNRKFSFQNADPTEGNYAEIDAGRKPDGEAMNAKEGMRRLGLVAGVLGACVGSYISYELLHPLLEQRHQHKEFQSLASSPVVRRAVLFLKNYPAVVKDYTPASDNPLDALDALFGSADGWRIDEGGIKKIYFGPNQELKSIEKENGATVYTTSSPPLSSYLLALVPPVLGFLLPWGSLAVLTWIGTGFFQSPK